jgi:hypothetical protein
MSEESEMDFQVNDSTYFLSLAENERRWLVFETSAMGTRPIPVYVDLREFDPPIVVQEEKQRIPN